MKKKKKKKKKTVCVLEAALKSVITGNNNCKIVNADKSRLWSWYTYLEKEQYNISRSNSISCSLSFWWRASFVASVAAVPSVSRRSHSLTQFDDGDGDDYHPSTAAAAAAAAVIIILGGVYKARGDEIDDYHCHHQLLQNCCKKEKERLFYFFFFFF